jgi:cell division septal protein FtsQ
MQPTPHSEAQQQIRAQRRARNAQVFYLVLWAAALGMGAGLGNSPLCWITDVRVVGPDPALAAAVAQKIHVPGEASLIFFPLSGLERQATSLPQVQSVEFSREPLHRLVVKVTRRVPKALVAHEPELLMVGEDGVITNLIPAGGKAPALPLFTGLPVASAQPGGRLAGTDAALVARAVEAISQAGLGSGARLDCTQPLDLRLTAAGVQGLLGATDNLERKLSLFAQVLQDLRRQGLEPSYIDVRDMKRPIWMPKSAGENAVGAPPKPVSAGVHKPAPAGTDDEKAPHAAAAHPATAGPKPHPHHPQTPTGDNAVQ